MLTIRTLALLLKSELYMQTIICLLSFLSIPFLGSSFFFFVIYFGLVGYILISFLFHLRRRLKTNVTQIRTYGVALIITGCIVSLIMGGFVAFVILFIIIVPAMIITYFFNTIVDYQNLIKKGVFYNPTPRRKHTPRDAKSE